MGMIWYHSAEERGRKYGRWFDMGPNDASTSSDDASGPGVSEQSEDTDSGHRAAIRNGVIGV